MFSRTFQHSEIFFVHFERIFRRNVTSRKIEIKEMKIYVVDETKYAKLYRIVLNMRYVSMVN